MITLEQADTVETLASGLAIAVDRRLISQEHGGAIFKKFLKENGYDVLKPVSNGKPTVTVEEVKK